MDWSSFPTRVTSGTEGVFPRLARENGQPVGFCSAWTGIEGMGQVEDLFVHPDYRHRGIATALMDRCVTRLRAQGVGPVVLVTDPGSTAKAMYGRLGWSPVAVCRQYGRRIAHEEKTGSNRDGLSSSLVVK